MTIAGMDFPTLTLVMLVYSVIGWVYESSIFSLGEQGKFMDRGCFLGPLCPIYSVVSVVSICLFGDMEAWKILLLSGLATCVIEYITSVSLEALFHKRYWDYSYYPLNIDGRVSVVSGLFFGIALLLMMKILHPFITSVLAEFPPMPRLVLCILTWVILITDIIWTCIGNLTKNNPVKRAYDAVVAWKQRRFDALNKWMNGKKDTLLIRAARKLLHSGKAVNRKFVAAEQRFKKKLRGKSEEAEA
ncbi:MAG: putative ABC transporter permease [Lachnospiraceae bacterium]|nr:putative ABC transporter permease [Lachnospiraceae bacterium]